MGTTDLFDAQIKDGVCKGTCAVIHKNELVYAGSITSVPEIKGSLVLLHADDFTKLAAHVNRSRH